MDKRSRALPKDFRHVKPVARMADSQMRIGGYGAVFYNEADPGTEYRLYDDWFERIMPGAFDKALAENDVRSFFNHDANFVLGRHRPGFASNTLSLSADETGLKYELTVSESRKDIFESIQRGDVDGSSFMFVPTERVWKEQTDDDGNRIDITEITEVRLYEVGPVVWPAYESATSEIRSMDKRDREAYREALKAEPDHRHIVEVESLLMGIA